jgi:hypothetical protein
MVALGGSPIKARLMRVIRLNECGVPQAGVGSLIVTKGFVSIEMSPTYQEGEEFIVRNANGDLCVNEQDPNSLTRVGLSFNLCQVDPDLIAIMAGERVLTTGSPTATGTGVAFGEGALLSRFSVEVWQPMAGQGACDVSGNPQFMYWAFANVGNASIGNMTFENAALTFAMSATTKAAAPQWGDGPTSPAYLPSALEPGEHFAFNITTVPPPAETGFGAATLTLS